MKLDNAIRQSDRKKINQRQIRSRERVTELGEVFTADREIQLMVDMWYEAAKQRGTNVVTATVLEPSCGNCGFLVELLKRKFIELRSLTGMDRLPNPRDSVVMLSSLYGIDISAENISDAFDVLSHFWLDEIRTYPNPTRTELCVAGLHVLQTNLIHADFLNPSSEKTLIERKSLAKGESVDEYLVELVWPLEQVIRPSQLELHGGRPMSSRIVSWHNVGACELA